MHILVHPTLHRHTAFRAFLEQLPERFEQEGECIFSSRNVIKLFAVEGAGAVAVKRYRRPLWLQRIVYTFFRPSKAVRAFRNAAALHRLGFRTPRAWAALEVRRNGLLADSYLVTEVTHRPPIAGVLNEASDFDHEVATAFARFAADLHAKGVLHHDLNSTNTLFERTPQGIAFEVIDINRMTFYPHCPPAAACYENLTRFTGRLDLFEWVAREYVRYRGLPSEEVARLLHTKERHDEAWRKRKARLKRLKRP